MMIGKKLRNPFVQQYLIEIVFPLVGYFFFDWDILIIGTYYLIDQFCSQFWFYRRAFWVRDKGPNTGYGAFFFIILIPAFLVMFVLESIWMFHIMTETQGFTIEESKEILFTFAKEELWLLFPVVLLVYHFRDQFTFYMPRQYMKFEFQRYMSFDFLGNLIILILFVLGSLIWVHMGFSNLVAILIFVSVKITFDLTVKRYFQKLSEKK